MAYKLRRGVSELLASILLIIIVLGLSALYYHYFIRQHDISVSTFVEVARLNRQRQVEILSLLYAHKAINDTATTVYLYVYNYGFKEVYINFVFVNNVTASFKIYSVDGVEASCIDVNSMCMIRVVVNRKISEPIYVTLVSTSGRVFSFRVP